MDRGLTVVLHSVASLGAEIATMGYTEKARELRRCTAMRKDGQPCTNYAAWGDGQRRCGTHGGRRRARLQTYVTAYDPCRCRAYAWPHRPGSGLCRWPDPPEWRCSIPESTHSLPRVRSDEMRQLVRMMRRAHRLRRRDSGMTW